MAGIPRSCIRLGNDQWTSYNGPIYIGRFTAAGQLDTTFAKSGFASASGIYGFNNVNAVFNRIAIDPYGGLVVCGSNATGDSSVPNDFVVARFLSTGAVDTTFGVNGIGTSHVAGSSTTALAMALQNNGDIVVVGRQWTSSTGETFAIASFTGGTTTSLAAPALMLASSNTTLSPSNPAPTAAALDAFWATDVEAERFSDTLTGAVTA